MTSQQFFHLFSQAPHHCFDDKTRTKSAGSGFAAADSMSLVVLAACDTTCWSSKESSKSNSGSRRSKTTEEEDPTRAATSCWKKYVDDRTPAFA